jgi:2-hydroxycyclohexanecarboxyl-CoA dehydrogenase
MTASVEARVAVVTGAGSGIGAACVELLERRGWRTAGIDLRTSRARLPIECDVADLDSMRDAVERVATHFARIDLLVTAAGYYEPGIPVTEISSQQWDRMMAVILGGTVNACLAVLPKMLTAGSGAIVGISSELALSGGTRNLHYVAAKGALIGFLKSLALEVANTEIRVNCVAPGPTDTPLLPPDSPSRSPEFLGQVPLRRLVSPEEVAHAVEYLANEGSIYCGEVLSPNAGVVT